MTELDRLKYCISNIHCVNKRLIAENRKLRDENSMLLKEISNINLITPRCDGDIPKLEEIPKSKVFSAFKMNLCIIILSALIATMAVVITK